MTFDMLTTILKENGADTSKEITGGMKLKEDLLLNSLGMMMLLVSIEQALCCELDFAECAGLVTVDDLYDMICHHQSSEGKP